MTNIINKENTLNKLLEGVNTLANVVKTTSGSKGRTYLLQKPDGSPYPTKDGVTIAKQIFHSDPVCNLAIKMLQEAAQLTVDSAGDNTTATTILAQALVQGIIEAIQAGHEPRFLLEEVEESVSIVEKELKKHSKKVNSLAKAIQIATIATNNAEVGHLVGSISWEARNNGIIHLEEGTGTTEIFQETGSHYSHPYEHRQLLGSNETSITIHEPYIAILTKEVTSFDSILPHVHHAQKENRHCVLISPSYSKIVVDAITYHCIKDGGKILPLYLQGEGNNKLEYAKDILALIDGDNVSKLVATKHGYTIFTKEVTPSITKRAEVILSQKYQEEEKYLRDKFDERISTLTQKVFTINVGGISSVEKRELHDRIEDGLLATRCAIVDGYVLGGGITLLNIASTLPQGIGHDIMAYALESPYRQILTNASKEIEYPETRGLPSTYGFNTTTSRWEDFRKSGILDSYKGVLESIRNATSVAKTIINLNGCILNANS